jgi:gas vesicle protein
MRLSSFIAGIGVGAGVALLLAPRSGDETREILTDKVEEGRRFVKRRAQEFREHANDTVEQGKRVIARQAKAVVAAAGSAEDTYVAKSQTNGG